MLCENSRFLDPGGLAAWLLGHPLSRAGCCCDKRSLLGSLQMPGISCAWLPHSSAGSPVQLAGSFAGESVAYVSPAGNESLFPPAAVSQASDTCHASRAQAPSC